LPERFDYAAVLDHASFAVELARQVRHCVLEMHLTKFIDSTGVGWLIRLRKQLASAGRELILLSPSPAVLRALAMMRLSDFFNIASDERALRRMLLDFSEAPKTSEMTSVTASMLHWRGEVTAANAGLVWNCTQMYLAQSSLDSTKTIDLSQVRFIDSTGLGLMVRAKKHCLAQRQSLNFVGLQPAVRNVLRLSRLEEFLLSSAQTSRPNRDQVLSEHR
jgi:anti-anti-sigma factor